MFEEIKNKLESGLYNFKSENTKLELLNNNISIQDKIKIIKSFPKKKRLDLLKKVFDFVIVDATENELKNAFKLLSLKDKLYVLKNIKDSYNKRLLIKDLPHITYIRMLLTLDLSADLSKLVISFLNIKEIKFLHSISTLLSYDDQVTILSYLPQAYLENILKNDKSFLKRIRGVELLALIKNDDIKLECLNYPNRYNIKIESHDHIYIMQTLSDETKFKLLEDEEMPSYDKRDLIYSLSDKGKLTYLKNNPNPFPFYINKYRFFKTFSKPNSRALLNVIDIYSNIFDNDVIITLINNLDINERLEFLYPTNNYRIQLSLERKVEIILQLPIQYKKQVLINAKQYDLELDGNSIGKIISKMDDLNIINILVLTDNTFEIPKDLMWKIIENLDHKIVIDLLKNKNPKVKQFVETYKTSLVKCLTSDERIEIILNKGKYGLVLDDLKKIKILSTITRFHDIKDNVFASFDNPQIAIDYFLNDLEKFNKLNEQIQLQLVSIIIKKENTQDVQLGLNILKYASRGKEILEKYDDIKQIFTYLGINIYDFVQYGINSSKHNWSSSLLKVINNQKIEHLSKVINYFFKQYYNEINDSKYVIQNFLEILTTFVKYETLCMNLVKENKPLTKEQKEDIRWLLNRTTTYTLTTLEEIAETRNNKIKSYKEISEKSNHITDIKNALFELLFDKNTNQIERCLLLTGSTSDLKILQFNNRKNKELKEVFECIILMTNFIEIILNTYDILKLKQQLLEYTTNTNHTKKLFGFFSKYEEYVRKIYEYDMKSSLTRISAIKPQNTIKASKLAQKYGGEVIDLSESQYVLAAHVKSYNETSEELINGISDGNSNFICMSPISHRGQHYYYGSVTGKTIFAYDEILDDSFICSSTENMGSNYSLKYNSAEVPTITRNQRGILETSEAKSGNNAEILLYRKGLKPCGIIVPDGEAISEEAIRCHKQYNLPFIITQKLDKTIENPDKIEQDKKIEVKEMPNLELLKEAIKDFKPKDNKKIAIISDIHALYEPSVACLTDIKSRGIDEIYSLGDNVGFGPNPKEVLDLLEEYNVKSVYGNHELYLEEGIEPFLEHFPSKESIERTRIMNEWIKKELTTSQIESIKQYPEKYEIIFENGKKLTLIHTGEPYNEIGKYSKKPNIDDNSVIIQGHKHFARRIDEKSIIVRAAGMGQTGDDDGLATYNIIELVDGEIKINTINVEYNRSNLLHTINESGMPVLAKGIITEWVGKKK